MHYWAARSTGGEFTPGNEVDELVWLPIADAMKQLDYRTDRKVLRRFAKQPADTQTVLVVRHGTAGSKSRYSGDDTKRPLDKRGRAQAEALVPSAAGLRRHRACMRPTGALPSDAGTACRRTGCAIHNEPPLTEEAYAKSPKRARHRMLRIAAQEGTPVICTQGKVIPDLIAWWCERDGIRPDKSRNHKGSTWVLSLADGRLVAADHIGGALAAKRSMPTRRPFGDHGARRGVVDLTLRDPPRVAVTHGVPASNLPAAALAGALRAAFLTTAFLTAAF